jgi:hypothetical protein
MPPPALRGCIEKPSTEEKNEIFGIRGYTSEFHRGFWVYPAIIIIIITLATLTLIQRLFAKSGDPMYHSPKASFITGKTLDESSHGDLASFNITSSEFVLAPLHFIKVS